ncbi:dihydroxyacetone kinase phosphoryl donor subunit DhaM [Arthrobacter sp. B3I4]|uniref:dihydroxyacetone kinase phosphoryl donor subunit DhaM n=1 Tax=Arthrobacter sp. B3I4 TaxID=3042267 RepID=UPI002786DFC4|nr:dihydroxyacetone kinase phosphoryl donor subunit DhaM [Arthrobacter sp. B3I4]MDQ0754589.1 PTS hybrid protein [Arthrobacter sp. B3I4]
MTVRLVVVSHSAKIADGAVELAAQMAPDVMIIPAGGTDDGRIGTSLEKVLAALEQAAGGSGVVVLTDLGSAVMTAESAVEFAADPGSVHLADAPLIEGLVAAAVSAQTGAGAETVKEAAEAVYRPPEHRHAEHEHQQPPEAQGDFELVNEAGMHARPAAKIAGALAGMDADVTVNGADGESMTELMMLGAGKGTILHVEASGPDAGKALEYLGDLIKAGFGEP